MSERSQRRDGQSLVEYAVIVAFIAIFSIAAIGYLQNRTNAMFIAQGETLEVPTFDAGSLVAYVPPSTPTATATVAVQPTVAPPPPSVTVTLPVVTGTIVAGPPPTGSGTEWGIETQTASPVIATETTIVASPTATAEPPTAPPVIVATIPPTATATSIPPTATKKPTATPTATAIPPTATATATAIPTPTPTPTSSPTPEPIPWWCYWFPNASGCP